MALHDVLERIAGEIPSSFRELDTVSELDARREFVDPILAELGWSGLNRLRREYSVGDQKRLKVDYALFGSDGKPVAFIEAKAPRENLAKHVQQVFKYADREEVDVCALTTGKLWWLYLPREREEFDDGQFASLHLTVMRPGTVSKILEEALGYEALTTGAAERNAKQLLQNRKDHDRLEAEIPQAWHRLANDSSTKLFDLVTEEVFQAIGQRPSSNEVRMALWGIFGKTKHPGLRRDRPTVAEIVRVVNEVCLPPTPVDTEPLDTTKQLAKDIAVYLAREHTDASFVEIAKQVGLKDDTTVMGGYTRVQSRVSARVNDSYAQTIHQWYPMVCERLDLEP